MLVDPWETSKRLDDSTDPIIFRGDFLLNRTQYVITISKFCHINNLKRLGSQWHPPREMHKMHFNYFGDAWFRSNPRYIPYSLCSLSEKEIPIDVRGLHLLCLRVRWLPSLLFFLTDAAQFLLKKSAEKVR